MNKENSHGIHFFFSWVIPHKSMALLSPQMLLITWLCWAFSSLDPWKHAPCLREFPRLLIYASLSPPRPVPETLLSSCLCRLELLRLQPQTPSTRLWLRSECQPTDASEFIPAELASETFSSLRQLHWSCELPVPSTSVPARATVLKLEQLFLHWDQLCNLGDLPSYVASLPHS